MKHVHFFKGYSRLGLINKPNKSDEINVGVERAPDAILTDAFLRQLESNYSLSHFVFSDPESVDKGRYIEIIAQESFAFARQINDQLRRDQTQVVVGGDHSVAFASVYALLSRLPPSATVGYVQFDSHADLHKLETSPSGNFHGMWLRALVGDVGSPVIDTVVTRHLDTDTMSLYGNLDLEPAEVEFLTRRHIDCWSEDDLLQDFDFAKQWCRSFVSKYDHIHVSFDIDVFDREFAPATGTPAPDGLDPSHVFPLLNEFSRAKSISVDLAEVNPTKDGAEETILIAQRVLETLLNI
jgi:arginase